LRIVQRQRTLSAEQPEKRGRQFDAFEIAVRERIHALRGFGKRVARGPISRGAFDFARGKDQRERIAKVDAMRERIVLARGCMSGACGACAARSARSACGTRGIGSLADEPALEQPDCLEKPEAVRLVEQTSDYARIDSPLRGKHRMISSPVRREMATSCTKLLIWT